MTMIRFLLMVACLGTFGWVTTGNSAQLTDDLAATLSNKSDGDYVSVLVFMRNQFDVKAIASQQRQQRQTRKAAHRILVEELRASANTDQAGLKILLEGGLGRGEVKSYKTYWIANALQVEATKAFLSEMQGRPDIELIAEDLPMQSLYQPQSPTTSGFLEEQGVFVGLHAIGADSMWALGYTGAGTLIASFDSGINGDHPALKNSYRGNHGYSAQQCWFDPIYGQTYPHWVSSLASGAHGTTTMGVMVGKDDATGDTVGVAFGAEWISAMVIDVPHANYLEAFQWAADPDGDPNTIEDVPDVVNNSWGFPQANLGCSDVFWGPIDNLEALGIVVVFACGNSGPGPMTLRNPANRASTPYTNFAVGAVSPTNTDSIWPSSSRGPSDCDGISIKPEVVAPGYKIRTTYPDLSIPYTNNATGTSYAAPYVCGAVALLRQYNPNATVEEIKAALMNSAVDKGTVGEDNTFGWGLINIPAAMALLPPNNETNLYVQRVSPDSVASGQQTDVVVTLRNSGVDALGVSGELTDPDAKVTIVSGTAGFGDLATNTSSSNSASPFQLQFAKSLPEGTTLTVNLHLQGNGGGYQKDVRLHFVIGATQIKSSYTHAADSCSFTVSNYGTYGLAAESVSPRGGVGFVYPSSGSNNLFQCGLMIGVDSGHVSDGVVNLTGSVDLDFAVAPGGNLTQLTGGGLGGVETTSRFTDENAHHPLGITVSQHSASYSGSPVDSRYVIVQYIITNSSLTDINGVHVGLFCDWDFPWGSGGSDRSGFARDLGLGYMWQNGSTKYRGTTVLNSEGVETFYAIQNLNIIYSSSGSLVTDAVKYNLLTHGLTDTAGTGVYDQSYCIATGPFNLAPGQSDTAAFAMIGGADLLSLRNSAEAARSRYAAAIGYVCGDADGVAPVDIADVVYLIAYIFSGGAAPTPLLAGDADCSLDIDVADVVYLINYIFSQGAAPCAACPK
jgi:subtilisin family serine protease